MATKKETEVKAAQVQDPDELVTVRLFKDGGKYSGDVFVSVNGERILIQRGKDVKIKRKFAEVLENSMNQDIQTANYIQEQSDDYDRKRSVLE